MSKVNPIASAQRGLQLYWNMYVRRATPTIIFSPGHVGSTALYLSLKSRGVFVVHVPTLLDENIPAGSPGSYRWTYLHVKRAVRPARIVSIARDPIAAMVSEFFAKVHWLTDVTKPAAVLPVDKLLDLFYQDYFQKKRHLSRLHWFELEMNPALGIDVFSIPFDPAAGYNRFQTGLYDVVILKTETDDAIKGRVVGDLVGIPDLKVIRANMGSLKRFADNYKAFKDQLQVPRETLDEIYESQFARHFYSADEIAAARKKWGG